MCGRYVSPETAAIERQWQVARRSGEVFAARFNVSPSMPVPVLWREGEALALGAARWGFVPHWWKEAKPPRFSHNARIEEAATKPMWREALRGAGLQAGGARCLVPALGWYEWRESDRQPFYLHRADGRLAALAGLVCPLPDGRGLSCAILTGPAQGALASVHDRTPILLSAEQEGPWLERGFATGAFQEERGAIQFHPVPRLVNSSRAEGPQLIEPLAA